MVLLPKRERHLLPPSPTTTSSNSSSIGSDCPDMKDFAMDGSDGDQFSPDGRSSAKKRCRQNLSHMSQEEKMNRRKMKNRVAAQSARDRKKAKMDEMEIKLSHFNEEKRKLAKEHEAIRKRNLQLEQENLDLKRRLMAQSQGVGPSANATTDSNLTAVVKEEPTGNSVSLGSAAETGTFEQPGSFGVTTQSQGLEGGSGSNLSLDDAIRLLVGGNRESDEILEWLEMCSNELLEGQLYEEQSGRSPQSSAIGTSTFSPFKQQPEQVQSDSQSHTELGSLESIRDLITFDHHYHRKDMEKEDVMLSDSSSFFQSNSSSAECSSCDESAIDLFPELM